MYRRTVEPGRWVTLPFAGEPLESVVHFGNGKDADLEIKFADGRRVEVGARIVRVEAEGSVVVQVTPWDDVSLQIDYRGAGLYLHSGQIGLPGEDDDLLEWVESWLAEGCREELRCVVDVKVHLASRQPGTGGASSAG